MTSPCDGCAAHCCTTVTFPLAVPRSVSSLDFVRFSLGFPGVEVGVGDDTWNLTIKTRCEHLRDGRCGVYGKPERPLRCSYYNEWQCTYKADYGRPTPPSLVRIRLEQFDALSERFEFDDQGAVVTVPSVGTVRDQVEQQWRHARETAAVATSLG